MPFYRCVMGSSSGGGGGGEDYLYVEDNGQKLYPKLTASSVVPFSMQSTFNNTIIIGNNIGSTSYLLRDCTAYNTILNIPEGVEIISRTFYNCTNYNQPFTIPSTAYAALSLFEGCTNYNIPLEIPNTVTGAAGMFTRCYKYNQRTVIPKSVQSVYNMFLACYNFNSEVVFESFNGVTMSTPQTYNYMFMSSNYNQILQLPNVTRYIYSMYANCQNFNKPFKLDVRTGNDLGRGQYLSAENVFNNCRNLNQPIYIDMGNYDSITSGTIKYLLANCINYGSNVIINTFINSTNNIKLNANYMLFNKDRGKRVNIYCQDTAPFISVTNAQSIVGAAITWAATTNGYYNAYYNIYVYTNVQQAMDSFNTYYNSYIN